MRIDHRETREPGRAILGPEQLIGPGALALDIRLPQSPDCDVPMVEPSVVAGISQPFAYVLGALELRAVNEAVVLTPDCAGDVECERSPDGRRNAQHGRRGDHGTACAIRQTELP